MMHLLGMVTEGVEGMDQIFHGFEIVQVVRVDVQDHRNIRVEL